MQVLHGQAFRMTGRMRVALNDEGESTCGSKGAAPPRGTEFTAATKQFCHPERSSVKDQHFALKRSAGERTNAGPSLEGVQDDSLYEGRAKR